MMSKVEFNINEYVWVKLTPHGEKIWRADRKQYMDHLPDWATLPEPDADGFHKFQLWALMNLFGEHCYNGGENCFETTIHFNNETLKPVPT